MILLDTSVIIAFLRGAPQAVDALASAWRREGPLTASVLSRYELLVGVRPGEEAGLSRVADQLTWIPVTDPVAAAAAAFRRSFGGSHSGIDSLDYLIAATAVHHRAQLWTLNIRHFPMFPGLRAPF